VAVSKDWIGKVEKTVFALHWIFVTALFLTTIYKIYEVSYFFAGAFITTGIVLAILVWMEAKAFEEEIDEIYLLYDIKEEVEKIKRKLMKKGGR
jgi:hypothetical protein